MDPMEGVAADLREDWSAVTEPMSDEELREIEEGHPGDPLRAMAPGASGTPPG